MNALKASLAVAAFLGAFAIGAGASATATFPAEIEKHLALDAGAVSAIAPPDGCHLCHVNGSTGGDPLTQFGTLMKSNGAVQNENATVDGALDAIQVTYPGVIADLKSGTDPNKDQDAGASSAAGAGAADLGLTPHYGCGASVSPGRPSLWSALLLAAMAAGFAGRRLKARAKNGPAAPDHRRRDHDRPGALVPRCREIEHDRRS